MSDSCARLHHHFNQLERYRFPFEPRRLPSNGIYVLFEKGERAHGVDRIVRVGTHTGQNQLRSRLEQHFIRENKDRSIFRKNIGRALLFRDDDPFLSQWELDLTTRAAKELHSARIDRERLKSVEREVTAYLQRNMSFAVVEVPNQSDRLYFESRIISTVSRCTVCESSMGWLGRSSPKAKIRESGLWLINELYKEPCSEADLLRLERL